MREHMKRTNIHLFLKTLPYIEEISDSLLLKLAERFKINSDNFRLIINVTCKIGVNRDN